MGDAGLRGAGARGVARPEFLLVLARDVRLPIAAVGARLAADLGLALADVTRALRRGRGLIELPGLREAQARSAARALAGLGFPCRPVPRSRIPDPPPALEVVAAEIRDDALAVVEGDDEAPERLGWARLGLVAAARTAVEEEPPLFGPTDRALLVTSNETEHAGGRAAGWIRSEVRSRRRQVPIHVLDLVYGSPDRRIRLIDRDFRFPTLGIPLAPVATENLRRFLEAAAARAPDALLSGSALAFLEGPMPPAYRFSRPRDFDGYVQWLLAWRSIFGDDDPEA